MDKRRSSRSAKRGNRPPSLLFLGVAFAIASLWVWSSVARVDGGALRQLGSFVEAADEAPVDDASSALP